MIPLLFLKAFITDSKEITRLCNNLDIAPPVVSYVELWHAPPPFRISKHASSTVEPPVVSYVEPAEPPVVSPVEPYLNTSCIHFLLISYPPNIAISSI